jgi:hypothetical protein
MTNFKLFRFFIECFGPQTNLHVDRIQKFNVFDFFEAFDLKRSKNDQNYI